MSTSTEHRGTDQEGDDDPIDHHAESSLRVERHPGRRQLKKSRLLTDRPPLPPIGVLLARPLMLAACAVAGGLLGAVVTGGNGYQATASVEFTVDSNDFTLVEVEGQTMAQRMATPAIVQRAAASINEPVDEFGANTTSLWRPGSTLVDVTAKASTADDAVARANALVEATIADFRYVVGQQLGAATSDANALISDRTLDDPAAETARRAQVGTSIGQRQDALTARSSSLSVSREATDASPAGLTKPMGAAIGFAVGLFVGCLLALALGARGLRTWSSTMLRRLDPGVEVLTTAQAPQLVGRLLQEEETYVAIVVARGAKDVAQAFVRDVQHLLARHGKSVTTVHPPADFDEVSSELLRAETSHDAHGQVDTDMLLVVVDAGTEAASLLQGRSGLRTIVLMRQRKTPVAEGLSAAKAYAASRPVVMLSK